MVEPTVEASVTPPVLNSVKLGDAKCAVEARGAFRIKDAEDYVPNPESEQLLVGLPVFEGPFDLLLHLIKKHSMDIFDIPIVLITQKYLEALEQIQEPNLDIAGEFLVMAATLLQIKSRMLLPKEEQDDADEIGELTGLDPRAELVRRLLEYQQFKEAALSLKGRTLLGSDVFLRPSSEFAVGVVFDKVPQSEQELEKFEIFELLELFAKSSERDVPKLQHNVSLERIHIRARINELIDYTKLRQQYAFKDVLGYFKVQNRYDVIVSFLALLECARLKLIRVEQSLESPELLVCAVEENLWLDASDSIDAVEDL